MTRCEFPVTETIDYKLEKCIKYVMETRSLERLLFVVQSGPTCQSRRAARLAVILSTALFCLCITDRAHAQLHFSHMEQH